MGLSTAYHLARAGVTDVVLVEQGELGSGSTCKAAGGVRAQFSDAVNIELGARSLRTFERFAEELDQEIDLHQVGYLFLLDDPRHVAAFEQNVALQNELGVPSRMIDVVEAQALSPLMVPTVCSPPRTRRPTATAPRRASSAGTPAPPAGPVPAWCGAAPSPRSARAGASLTEVVTDRGSIATDTVVCAAGAWSRALAAMVGVDLPVEPLRRQILTTEPMPGLDPPDPLHHRLLHLVLLPRRGTGPPPGDVGPARDAGVQADGVRRVARRARGRDRATGALDRRGRPAPAGGPGCTR